MRIPTLLVPLLLMLSSCGSPPKPPSVDESHRRPANAAVAVSLQVCESKLQDTRIAASESDLAAATAKATAIRLASQQQALAAQALRADDRRNVVYSILFAYGDTRVVLSQGEAARLVEEARFSALIVLRGRTDGSAESPAESRVARERSEAVRAYLVQAGVAPARIRATWQPIGDNADDNASEGGRRLNRRVELELYRTAPRFASLELNSAL
jgi:outer membrane protein OmpA-like peptidoglycan-associated protein